MAGDQAGHRLAATLEEPAFPAYIEKQMSAAVPVGNPPFGYHALHEFAGKSSAVSREADAVRNAAATVAEAAERSQALFGRKAAAISELLALQSECSEEGWDGHGAAPVDTLAVLMTQWFLRALPDHMPLPEFAAEPDGSISLDWILSRNRLFSVSIGPGNRLAFAWLDGTDSGHGVVFFDGQVVPQRILEGIKLITGSGHAGLRAA